LRFGALAIRSAVRYAGDDDLGVGELALEGGVRSVLVGRDDQLVATAFEEAPEAELAGHAAE